MSPRISIRNWTLHFPKRFKDHIFQTKDESPVNMPHHYSGWQHWQWLMQQWRAGCVGRADGILRRFCAQMFCRVDTVSSDIFDRTHLPTHIHRSVRPSSAALCNFTNVTSFNVKFVRYVPVTWPKNPDAVLFRFKIIRASSQILVSVFIDVFKGPFWTTLFI